MWWWCCCFGHCYSVAMCATQSLRRQQGVSRLDANWKYYVRNTRSLLPSSSTLPNQNTVETGTPNQSFCIDFSNEFFILLRSLLLLLLVSNWLKITCYCVSLSSIVTSWKRGVFFVSIEINKNEMRKSEFRREHSQQWPTQFCAFGVVSIDCYVSFSNWRKHQWIEIICGWRFYDVFSIVFACPFDLK